MKGVWLFFFKWQLISQESSVTEEKISRRETKLLAADSTQRLLYGAMSQMLAAAAVIPESSHHPAHCYRTNNPNRISAAHGSWIQLSSNMHVFHPHAVISQPRHKGWLWSHFGCVLVLRLTLFSGRKCWKCSAHPKYNFWSGFFYFTHLNKSHESKTRKTFQLQIQLESIDLLVKIMTPLMCRFFL